MCDKDALKSTALPFMKGRGNALSCYDVFANLNSLRCEAKVAEACAMKFGAAAQKPWFSTCGLQPLWR